MLTIFRPEVIERGDETILQAMFECGNVHDILWFSTTKEFGRYLCHERGDAFLVALLLYAMKRGEDICVKAPISERLYYSLTKHFIKVIAETFPGYSHIQIHCDIDTNHIENAGGVGTGLSCGIDSFYTVVEHTDRPCPPSYRLTHLAFFNVGASGDNGGDRARELYQQRIEVIRPCADELHLPMVTLDSNISEILNMDYVQSHTYRNAAAVLAIQKLFKVYYYSSGYSLRQFELNYHDSSHYDTYALDMLSTDTLKIISSGEMCSRVEKTDIVSTFPLSYKYLNVCVMTETNCSRCHKCQRTLVTLDILGKLQLYNHVFDLYDYRKHRSKYFGAILGGRKSDLLKQEIYEKIKQENFKIPIGAYLYKYPMKIYLFGVIHSPSLIRKQYRRLKKLGYFP